VELELVCEEEAVGRNLMMGLGDVKRRLNQLLMSCLLPPLSVVRKWSS
jgi:hypothetical protein